MKQTYGLILDEHKSLVALQTKCNPLETIFRSCIRHSRGSRASDLGWHWSESEERHAGMIASFELRISHRPVCFGLSSLLLIS